MAVSQSQHIVSYSHERVKSNCIPVALKKFKKKKDKKTKIKYN